MNYTRLIFGMDAHYENLPASRLHVSIIPGKLLGWMLL